MSGRSQPGGEWIERLQTLAHETVERSSSSLASFQRLLTAVAASGLTPERLGAELPRFGQEHGTQAYDQLTRVASAFMAGALGLVGRYRDDYLRALLPSSRVAEIGPPPSLPPPPDKPTATDWLTWYQLLAVRAGEQQMWASRLYGVLLDEVSARRLRPESVQRAGRDFIERMLPTYLTEMAELNCRLATDVLGIADNSVESLHAVLFGEAPPDELAVNVRGPAGTTVTGTLSVENSRAEAADVECVATPAPGFTLSTAPMRFRLAPGESRPLAVHVTLPSEPTGGRRYAGTVVVRGQGEGDLVIQVRARVDAPAETTAPPQAAPSPPSGGTGPAGPVVPEAPDRPVGDVGGEPANGAPAGG